MSDENSAADSSIPSMVHSLVNAIVDGVMHGRYVPGQRLIAADLADEYNVSRAPVREALHMLAGEGVVELIANRGARIRRLSVKERIDFLEFTESICVLGVRRATGRMREPECREVVEVRFAALEEATARRNAKDFVNAIYQYHVELNRVSENEFLDFFYRRPYNRFYTLILAEFLPGNYWEPYIFNYRRIHETILSGDAHSAVVTFTSHIRWVLSVMRDQSVKGLPGS